MSCSDPSSSDNSNLGSGGAAAGQSASTGGASAGKSSGGASGSGLSGRSGASSGGPGGAGSGGMSGASSGGTSSGGVSAAAGGISTGGTQGLAGMSGRGGSAPGGATGSGGSAGGSSTCTESGFHVKDGLVYDSKCQEFVMRGVNYPYVWYASRNTQQDLTAIAATGANTVRLVLATGARWARTTAANLTALIQAAKQAKLVSVLEVHDQTGYREQAESVPLENAVSYWTSPEIAAALKDQQGHVLINIANEPNGNDTTANWAPSHVAAVQALRNAGFNHTLVVDAPNWGQDWEGTMRDGGGQSIWEADSQKNLIFSVHMYDVYEMSSTISHYFNTFLTAYQAPLIVGEFAADHGAASNGMIKQVDEGAILSFAENLGIGYLGWSWSGNSPELSSLDLTTNFDASKLTPWGTRLIHGENGIKMTASPCACFD